MFGAGLARVGDVDGDGIPDFVVGSPRNCSPREARGAVWLVSTGTRKTIFEVSGGQRTNLFGELVAGPGDLDGDGVPDFLVGEPWGCAITAYSGCTGAILHSLRGAPSQQHTSFWLSCGLSACGVGDVNDDGCDDYAVGCMHADSLARDPGATWVISGRDGSLLRSIEAETPSQHRGLSLAAVGDLDGDGGSELALWTPGIGDPIEVVSIRSGARIHSVSPQSAPEALEIQLVGGKDLDGDSVPDFVASMVLSRQNNSIVQAFSGRNAAPLRSWSRRGEGWFGLSVDLLDDQNSDRTPELLVTSPGSGAYVSWALVLDGKEDREIHSQASGPLNTGYFGISACAMCDIDGDGIEDYLVGEANWRTGCELPGFVRLFSGATGKELARWTRKDVQLRLR